MFSIAQAITQNTVSLLKKRVKTPCIKRCFNGITLQLYIQAHTMNNCVVFLLTIFYFVAARRSLLQLEQIEKFITDGDNGHTCIFINLTGRVVLKNNYLPGSAGSRRTTSVENIFHF